MNGYGALDTANRLGSRNERFIALTLIAEGLNQRNNAEIRSKAFPDGSGGFIRAGKPSPEK